MTHPTVREVVAPDDRPVHPNTGVTPEWVVRAFLEGLREPDAPTDDDGLRSAYHLSAPAYRREVGGFEGFRDRLAAPLFGPLVGHERAERGAVEVNDAVTETTQAVLVATGDGTGGRAVERARAGARDGTGAHDRGGDDEAPDGGRLAGGSRGRDDGRDDEYMYEFVVEKQADGKYAGCWLVRDVELTMNSRRPGFRHLPTVEFGGEEIKCEPGAVLRDVLLQAAGVNPHNDRTSYANCSGNGVCGTCAVQVENMVVGENVREPTGQEKRRMKFPPLRGSDVPNLRLACQTRVVDDVRVVKHEGLWGQHLAGIEAETETETETTADGAPDGDGDGGGNDGAREVRVEPGEYDARVDAVD
jgi:ferredoxin